MLWFALGAGPPHFWKVPGPTGVSGPGGCLWGTAARLAVLLVGVGGVLVDDDLFHGAGGVAPSGELVQVVEVPLLGGPP